MPYVRDSLRRGRQFASIVQMHEEAVTWCRQAAGQRSCRPLSGAAPVAVFAAAEAGAVAGQAVRAGHLVEGTVGPDIHVKAGHTLYSVPWRYIGRPGRHPLHRGDGADLRRRAADRHAPVPGERQAHRHRSLSTGADRLPHADTDLVPTAGHRVRAGLCRGDRRAARGERVVPAAGRSGRAGPGQQVRRGSARTGLRQGDRRGGSDLPHDQGRPRRRAGSRPRPAPAGDGGAAAFLHRPSRLFENVVAMPTPNTATTSDDHGGSDEPRAGVSA